MRRYLICIVLLASVGSLADAPKHPLVTGHVNHAHLYKINGARGVFCFVDNATSEGDYIEVSSQWFGYCHSTGANKTKDTFGTAQAPYHGSATSWIINVLDVSKS